MDNFYMWTIFSYFFKLHFLETIQKENYPSSYFLILIFPTHENVYGYILYIIIYIYICLCIYIYIYINFLNIHF